MNASIAFGALQIIVGLGMTYFCRVELRLGWASRRWPRTSGRICDSILFEGVSLDTTTDGTMAPTTRRFKNFDYVYEYSVRDQTYRASTFDFSPFNWGDGTHFIDDQVTVFYCPDSPATAVLRPGVNVSMLIGPLFTLCGMGILIYGLSQL